MTGTNGLYGIGGLPAGSFTIGVDTNTLASGLRQIYDPDSILDNRTSVTLTDGEVRNTVSFSYAYSRSISGSVLVDVNGNGLEDVVDTNGYSGVTIELLTNGVVSATVTTSATGGYSFTNLMPGAYTVRMVKPANGYSTAPGGNPIPVTLLSEASDIDNNFYATKYATIGDFVCST